MRYGSVKAKTLGQSQFFERRRAAACRRLPQRTQRTQREINKLIETTIRLPFEGIGKPEALRENLAGFWSRRIDDTNQLVYAVDDEYLTIIACRYHYSDWHLRSGFAGKKAIAIRFAMKFVN